MTVRAPLSTDPVVVGPGYSAVRIRCDGEFYADARNRTITAFSESNPLPLSHIGGRAPGAVMLQRCNDGRYRGRCECGIDYDWTEEEAFGNAIEAMFL